MVRFDLAAGWPGVFRPLRHYVPDDAYRLRLGDRWVYFAVCDGACWLPGEGASELPLCVKCWSASQRFQSSDTEDACRGQPDCDRSIDLLNNPEAGYMPNQAHPDQARAFLRAFGEELRQARKERGWTRKDLQARLVSEVSVYTITTYEDGTRQCPVLRLLELADALGTSAPDILARALERIGARDEPLPFLKLDLGAVAKDHNKLKPLRRWAECRLNEDPPGQRAVIQLDLPALESLAEVCGLDTVDLIRQLRDDERA